MESPTLPCRAWIERFKAASLRDVHNDCREVTQVSEPGVNRISMDSDDFIAYGQAM